MHSRDAARWVLLAFVYAATVPYGLYRLWEYFPETPTVGFLTAFALAAAVVAALLSAFTRADSAVVLAAMVAGIVLTFGASALAEGGVRIADLRFGLYAMAFVGVGWILGAAVGWFLGETVSERGFNVRTRGVASVTGVVVVLAFVTALVGRAVFSLQDDATLYQAGLGLLWGGSLLLGFTGVWWVDYRIRVFVPLVAMLPFVTVVTSAVTAPLADVFGLRFSNEFPITEALIILAGTIVALITVGAVIARATRYFEADEPVMADTERV